MVGFDADCQRGMNEAGERHRELLEHRQEITRLESEPGEFTKAFRELMKRGIPRKSELRIKIEKNASEACDRIDRQAEQLKAKIEAIGYLLEVSAPMTPQQEECWPVLKKALKGT